MATGKVKLTEKEDEEMEAGSIKDYILKRIKFIDSEIRKIDIKEIDTHYPIRDLFFLFMWTKE